MKSYSHALKSYIENSGLSLVEIETKLREKGLSTNKAYISKLQNGKLPPAGDEINKALAEVLNADEDEFILLAYAEKAPILNEIIDTLIDSFKNILLQNKPFIETLLSTMYNIEINNDENYEEIIDSFFSSITMKDSIQLIKFVTSGLGERQFADYTQFDNGLIQIDPTQFITNEEEKRRIQERFEMNKQDELRHLTNEERLFLLEQLKLYRSLKLKFS